MTRSTASGQTCAVAPDGRILAMTGAFIEAALTVSVPIVTEHTFYTKYGDYLPCVFLAAALLMLIVGVFRRICKGYGRAG
jgi:apolipoprotein N-acyltransferase